MALLCRPSTVLKWMSLYCMFFILRFEIALCWPCWKSCAHFGRLLSNSYRAPNENKRLHESSKLNLVWCAILINVSTTVSEGIDNFCFKVEDKIIQKLAPNLYSLPCFNFLLMNKKPILPIRYIFPLPLTRTPGPGQLATAKNFSWRIESEMEKHQIAK